MHRRVLIFVLCLISARFAECADAPTINDLRREVEELRKRLSDRPVAVPRQIESHVAQRFGPDAAVTTKSGKLQIGGLLQIWAYNIQNDNDGVVDLGQVVVGPGSTATHNEEADNDSFRMRRAELRFTLDIHENISAHITLDFAREATAFPSFPSNQGSTITGDHDVSFFNPCECDTGIFDPRQIGAGVGVGNRILQDAYINYHGVLPHHDVSIGQFKRRIGEEGTRDSAELDFIERAMITQPAELRDLGVQVHGTWLDGRVQYWGGLFDGAGTAFQPRSNRSDDNDAKDGAFTLQVRPIRKHERWGTLELGYSILYGIGGEAAGHDPGSAPVNGLNQNPTVHTMQYAWASYHPGGPVRGWWLRGEWGNIRDRFAPGAAMSGLDVASTGPAPFNIQGWYFSTGYHLGQSRFCDNLKWSTLRNLEFAFRYESMQNIFFHDLVVPERRFDLFKTQVYTAGVNYYIKGSRAKLQLNYNWLIEEDRVDNDDRQLRETSNNSIVINFQIAF